MSCALVAVYKRARNKSERQKQWPLGAGSFVQQVYRISKHAPQVIPLPKKHLTISICATKAARR